MGISIISVGVPIADENIQEYHLSSNISLLDADIVLFRPTFARLYHTYSQYQGSPALDDHDSFKLRGYVSHWKREIRECIDAGKTVIVFLGPLETVFVATGEHSYSGTGRSRVTTRHVEPLTNYASIPVDLTPIATSGRGMQLAARGAEFLATYWSEFGELSSYRSTFSTPKVAPLVITKTGSKTVGTAVRSQKSAGAIVLLPDMDFVDKDFVGSDGGWNDAGRQFSHRLVAALTHLDRALKSTDASTAPPDWTRAAAYKLEAEDQLGSELARIEAEIARVAEEKAEIQLKLTEATKLKGLLFEKGKPLEAAILEALRILGFDASGLREAESEFDAVFSSDEGRFVGEAEGKDSKAISIDKLRQLSMNIHEDLQRDDVSEPAKAVLFGNAYRLSPPADRDEFFTEKCVSVAKATSVTLVPTTQLFSVAQYLLKVDDPDFAAACRASLISGAGPVAFPGIPALDDEGDEVTSAD